VRDNALSPSTVEFVDYAEILQPESVDIDTFYHIESVVGEPDYINDAEWWDVTAIYSDSIRIAERRYPEHYHCFLKIDALNSFGVPIRDLVEVYVINGNAMLSDDYYEQYNKYVSSTSFAQRDTLIDIREHIELSDEDKGWEKIQRLRPFHVSIE